MLSFLRRLAMLVLFCTLVFPVHAQTTYYVDDTATGTDTGASWADAFTDLQDALAAADSGDEIRVAEGSYAPGDGSDENVTFALPDSVAVYGGFPDGGGPFDQRDFSAHETVLTGNPDGDGTPDIDNIATADTVGAATRLDGFTIADGRRGVNVNGGSPTLVNLLIHSNEETSGACMEIVVSSPTLVNVTCRNNTGFFNGGALYLFQSDVTVVNGVFAENEAGDGGGAVSLVSGSTLSLINTTVTGNHAGYRGGALYVSSGRVTVENSIVWGNTADDDGDQAYVGTGANPENDTLAVRQSLLEGDSSQVGGGGTTIDDGGLSDADPQIVGSDPQCLRPTSFAINRGDPALLPADSLDLDRDGDVTEPLPLDRGGRDRVVGAELDLGAYEIHDTDVEACAPPPGATYYVDDTATGANTGASWEDAFTKLQDALAAASSGDEIRVAEGTYAPGDGSDATATFALPDGAAVSGGFPDGGGPFDQRDFSAHETVLTGDPNGDGSSDILNVVTADSVGAATRLDGFTIADGHRGIRVDGGGPTLVNLLVHSNGMSSGACARVLESDPLLVTVTCRNNSASFIGGALYVRKFSNVTVVNGVIAGNDVSDTGGGVYVTGVSTVSLINSTVTGNHAGIRGGALYLSSGRVTVENSIFWDNTAGTEGDQVHIMSVDTLEVQHSLIEGGLGDVSGSGTAVDNGGTLDADPLFVDAGNGNLRLQAGSPAVDAGDDALLPVDAFDFDRDGNVVTEPISSDADRTLRLEGSAVDLGAYERGNAPLPVEITSFTATRDGTTVRLEWATASETNNAGFEIQEREEGGAGEWERLGFVEGAGTTSEPQDYAFAAEGLDVGTYAFRLKQVDTDGTTRYSETVAVTLGLGRPYVVTKPSPNPTSRGATLKVTVRESQHVQVIVYDALGRRISTLYDGKLAANRPEPLRVGSRLPSGPYFLRAVGETFTATRRVTVVR